MPTQFEESWFAISGSDGTDYSYRFSNYDAATELSGTASIDLTYTSSMFDNFPITGRAYSGSLGDIFSIYKLSGGTGESALSGYLTNEAHILPTDP